MPCAWHLVFARSLCSKDSNARVSRIGLDFSWFWCRMWNISWFKNCSKHRKINHPIFCCQDFLANLGMDWIEALGKTVTSCWGNHWLPLWYFSGAYCSGTALSHGRVPGWMTSRWKTPGIDGNWYWMVLSKFFCSLLAEGDFRIDAYFLQRG